MRSTTCLQRYRATRMGREEIQQLSPRDPLAEYRSTPPIHSVSMKNILGDIQTDYDSLRHGPLPQVVLNTSTLAHQCRRGRPPHHKPVWSKVAGNVRYSTLRGLNSDLARGLRRANSRNARPGSGR